MSISGMAELESEQSSINGPPSMLFDPVSAGVEPEFVEPYDEKCPLCGKMLLNPYQTQCGHRLCKQCLDNHLMHNGDPSRCPFGEDDCEDISLGLNNGSVYPDYYLLKQLKAKMVYCPYKDLGCPETIRFGHLSSHRKACEYGRVPCPNAGVGCPEKVFPSDLEDHTKLCTYTPTTCPHCGQTPIATCLMEEHLKECSMVEILCNNKCGAVMLRGEFPNHMEVCVNRPVECKFYRMGCTFKGSAAEVSDHENKESALHLEMVVSHCELLEKRMKNLEDAQTSSTASSAKLTEDMLKVHTRKLGHHEKMIKETQKMVAEQAVKQRMTQNSGGSSVSTDTMDAVTRRMDTLEAANTTAMQLIKAVQEKSLPDLILRLQILETASYDGVLLWKIQDYSKRKADAKRSGGVQSLYSQAFYTSRHGYRMCARVYLNGDGVGLNSHLSLFFVVMRGEYDVLLKWPIRQKVTLMLLDQTGRGRHIQDTFRPDPASSSFQKPQTNMNIASGCPMFLSHDILEAKNSPYLQDETLFIKIVVDISDLARV